MADFLSFEVPADAPASELTETGEGSYAHKTDHVETMIGNLIDVFREDCPRNQAVLETVGEEIQEIEDVIAAMRTAWDLDTATGHRLDTIGKWVGRRSRGGLDTERYRALLRVQWLVNQSNGDIEEMLDIARLLVPETDDISAGEEQPARMRFIFSTYGAAGEDLVREILTAAKPGGVRLYLGPPTIGSTDGDPEGGVIGSTDGDPLGFRLD